MVSSAHVIRDATVTHIKCVSAMVIFAKTLVVASMQPVEFIRISHSAIVHRIIHRAIQCMHVRTIFRTILLDSDKTYINERYNNIKIN